MPYQRGNRWHADFYVTDPKTGIRERFRHALGKHVKSLKAAQKAERDLEQQARAELAARAAAPDELPRAAFSGFVDRWLDLCVVPDLRPSTVKLYESIARTWLTPHFGDRQMIDVASALSVSAFRRTLHDAVEADEIGPKWANEVLGCLGSMLTTAKRWGYLREVPELPKFEVETGAPPFYTQTQAAELLAAAHRHRPAWYPVFLVGFRTGLRLGELAALAPEDLDLAARRLWVRHSTTTGARIVAGKAERFRATTAPKSKRSRSVSLPPDVVAWFRQHPPAGSLVFEPDGTPVTRERLKYPWDLCVRIAGLPAMTPHGMRHSFASQLVMAGVPIAHVQALLGHADSKTTQRYAHLAPESTVGITDVLAGRALDTIRSQSPAPTPSDRAPMRLVVVGAVGFEPTDDDGDEPA